VVAVSLRKKNTTRMEFLQLIVRSK